MGDFVEMEVIVVEELEDKVAYLEGQIKTLTDFLVANFGIDVGLRYPVCEETVRDPDYWFGGMCLGCAGELAEKQGEPKGEGE